MQPCSESASDLKKLNGEKGNWQPLHSRVGVLLAYLMVSCEKYGQVRLAESGRNGFALTFGRNKLTFG